MNGRTGMTGSMCLHSIPQLVKARMTSNTKWKPSGKELEEWKDFRKLPREQQQDIEEKRLRELRETFDDILS